MKKRWNILTATLALLATGTAFASNPGELTVRDNGKLFSAEGIKAAKDAFAAEPFDSPTKILLVTFEGLPEKKKAEFALLKEKSEKDRFITQWARDEATTEGAKGIFVLVSSHPNSIRVVDSEQMRANRGFTSKKCERMQDILTDGFKASVGKVDTDEKAARDGGLLKAVDYAREQLKGTSAVSTTASPSPTSKVRAEKGGAGMSLLAWVVIIGVVLLGVWLVIGLIRAFTGMGGGGGGYGGGGGGYGGGGGGGGFMSSLMGGMFGTMAGMWMYNSLMGGGMSNMHAGDYGGSSGGGDTGGGGTAAGDDGNFDNGADGGGGGDWGGDAGGGDFGGGDFGGGDFGGGGGGGDW